MPQAATHSSVMQTTNDLQLLVFTLAAEEYALGLTDALEIIRTPDITPVPNMPASVKGVANLRGKVLTVIDVKEMFGLAEEGDVQVVKEAKIEEIKEVEEVEDGRNENRKSSNSSTSSNQHLIIAEKGNDLFGLLVDSASEVLRTSSNNAKSTPDLFQGKQEAAYIKGVIVLEEDGRTEVEENGEDTNTEKRVPEAESRIILHLDIAKVLESFQPAAAQTDATQETTEATETVTPNLTPNA